jgi:hypothetical protein
MRLGFSRRMFEILSNIKVNDNPSTGSRVVPRQTDRQTDIQTDRQTDMKKLIVALWEFSEITDILILMPHKHSRTSITLTDKTSFNYYCNNIGIV